MASGDITADARPLRPRSIWDELREQIDVARYRPRVREGLFWRQLRTARGDESVIASLLGLLFVLLCIMLFGVALTRRAWSYAQALVIAGRRATGFASDRWHRQRQAL